MSTTIDERVVSMKFDNAKFEANVKVTLKSIETLKKSLKFEDAVKAFADINDATKDLNKDLNKVDATAKKINMSTLDRSVEAIKNKFSDIVQRVTHVDSATKKLDMSVMGRAIDAIKNKFSDILGHVSNVDSATDKIDMSVMGDSLDDVVAKINSVTEEVADIDRAADKVDMSVMGTAIDRVKSKFADIVNHISLVDHAAKRLDLSAFGSGLDSIKTKIAGIVTNFSDVDNVTKKLNDGLSKFDDTADGIVEGIADITYASNRLDLAIFRNGLADATSKFKAMDIIGVTALANITNSAVNAGKKILSALTIDPVKTGLDEYEIKINAIQTIMSNTASKGTTMDDVTAVLGELNEYADKTIYNFAEMTRNIGTFTAAGVGLETSAAAIKGIANLAAASGSTSQQASTAMYQLSQALAAGKIQLMDWNSVVNAGMGGELFQSALIRTSELMKTGAKEAIAMHGTFRQSLTQSGWLTADVLTETLKQISGAYTDAELLSQGYTEEQVRDIQALAKNATDAATKVKTLTQLWDTLKESAQSGWSQTWELIIGDFEEAKVFYTELSDLFGGIIGSSAEARNGLLEGALTSQWDQFITKVNDAGVKTEAFQAVLGDVARTHHISLDRMIKEHGSLEEAINKGKISSELLNESLKVMNGEIGGTPQWNYYISQIENAGISAEQFEKTLTEVAKTHHISIDRMVRENGSLEEAFVNGKISSELLSETITKLAKETDKTIGLTDEQAESLRNLANEADKAGTPMNDLLTMMGKPNGRELLIDSLRNSLNALIHICSTAKEAFREVFPKTTALELYTLIEKIHEFTESFEMSAETTDKLRTTFKGLFSGISVGISFIKELANRVVGLASNMSGLGTTILDFTSRIGDWLIGIRESTVKSDIFAKSLDTVSRFISGLISDIGALGSYLKDNFALPGLEGFLDFLNGIWDVLIKITDGVSNMVTSISQAFANSLRAGDIKSIMDILNAGILTVILTDFKSFTKELTGTLDDVKKAVGGVNSIFKDFAEIPKNITEVLGAVKDTLVTYQTEIKATAILTIASAVAILAGAVTMLALIDPEKLTDSLGAVSMLFIDLIGTMSIFSKLGLDILNTVKTATVMISMAVAINILASALAKVAEVDSGKLYDSVFAITALSGIMVASAKILSSETETVVTGAGQMIIFAAAIKILASACKDLSTLSFDELTTGLTGVGALMIGVGVFLSEAKFNKGTIKSATSIVILAASMKVFASAVKDFSTMDMTELSKGLVSIGVLIAGLTVFTRQVGDSKGLISTAVSIVIIGGAMKVFASAVKDFAAMDLQELSRGVSALGITLAAVVAALNYVPKNIVSIAAGLVIVSGALLVLAEAVTKMSGMSWTELATGLIALGGAMAILVVGLNKMTGTVAGSAALLIASGAIATMAKAMASVSGMTFTELCTGLSALGGAMLILVHGLKQMSTTLAGSAALLVAAGALAVIAPALRLLGAMDLGALVIALGALAGVFTIFGVAGKLLAPMVPTLMGLGVSVALFGAACLLTGTGIAALATGLTALAAAGTAAIDTIVGAIEATVKLIPTVATEIGKGLIAFMEILSKGIPAIGDAIKAIILTLVDILVETAPAIAKGMLELMLSAVELLSDYVPKILEYIVKFIVTMVDKLADYIPVLVTTFMKFIGAFFRAIAEAIGSLDADALVNLITSFGMMAALIAAIKLITPMIPTAIAGVIGMGVLIAELGLVLAAFGALAQIPGLTWLIGEGGDFLQAVGTAIGQFVGGIIAGVAEGAMSTLPQIGLYLSQFMVNATPFFVGAKLIDTAAMEGIKTLAEAILILTAANILDGLTRFFTGGNSLTKFGRELAAFGPYFSKYYDSVKSIDAKVVTASTNAAKSLSELSKNLPNQGGIISWFTGDNKLSDFGKNLVPFGKAMKDYANEVSGIDSTAVQNSATAAKALAELATDIPNQGGILSWFTGDNKMADFGKNLVSFGEDFADYSEHMRNVDATVLSSTTNAAKSIVELSKSLPDDEGWFSDQTTLAEFGKQLSNFGSEFGMYYAYISPIDATKLSVITAEIKDIVSMARGMGTINADGMTNFVSALTELGRSGIKGFITAFNDAKESVSMAINDMLTSATQALSGKYSEFNNIGKLSLTHYANGVVDGKSNILTNFNDLMNAIVYTLGTKNAEFNTAGNTIITNFATGIRTKSVAVSDEVNLMLTKVLTRIKNKYSEFSSAGQTLMVQLISGVRSKSDGVSSAFTSNLSGAVSSIRSYYSNFYGAGKYLAQGFAEGIDDYAYLVEDAARDMAYDAYRAAMNELQAHSPSRLFREVGSYVPLGFALGIKDEQKTVENSTTSMVDSVINNTKNIVARIADAINSDIDAQPTIRPVLDLTDVKAKANRLNVMFSRTQAMSISSRMNKTSVGEDQNGENVPTGGATYSFTQNNYSPKALSRSEIYRQTKNQFAAIERVVPV